MVLDRMQTEQAGLSFSGEHFGDEFLQLCLQILIEQ